MNASRIVRIYSDLNNNVYARVEDKSILKFDSSLSYQWTIGWTETDRLTILASAVTPSGDIFVGASDGAAYSDALVVKYTSDGEESWRTPWSSTGAQATGAIAIASDGAVYATGYSTGQAPGNPASASGGDWLARYESTGELTWIKQFADENFASTSTLAGRESLALNQSDSLYTVSSDNWSGLSVDTYDLNGNKLLSVPVNRASVAGFPTSSIGDIRLAPDEKSIWSWVYQDGSNGYTAGLYLLQLSLEDSALRYWQSEPTRTTEIDAVEGVTWTGTMMPIAIRQFAIGENTIYLAGIYSNNYVYGSNPPPSTTPAFVGRYDFDGNRIWFQEFLLESAPASFDINNLGAITTDADGNVVVALNPISGTQPHQSYLFRLKADDGTLLEL